MRRLIAILLMLLLPLQSAWALVAMPCKGHVNLPRAVAQAQEDHHAGHLAAMAGHGHHAMHDDATAAHEHHAHHDAAPPAGHDDGSGTTHTSQSGDACSGSAACMSLHSPPLAAGFDAGLPALVLPGWLPPAEGAAFSSVPPQRQHRPPIGLAA